MVVTYQKTLRVDRVSWRQPFTSDITPPVPFRVFIGGVLVSQFVSTDGNGNYRLNSDQGSVFIEVLDKDCSIPEIAFPGRITIGWRSVVGAVEYKVEEFVSAVFVLRKTVEDDGVGAFTFLSRFLEDVTTHLFQVVPVDAAGNLGTPLSFSVLMVRHPDVPNVGYSYDGAGPKTVTISST